MLIRPEQPADIASIHGVHVAGFPTPLEARLVDHLRDSGHLTISLVAEIDSLIVGHVAFSPVTAAVSAAPGVGLAPVAVLLSHRRQGIAAQLVQQGLDRCKSAGIGWAVVLGEPAYYSRFGFRPAAEFGLTDEYQGGPYFQALELLPDSLPKSAGLVKYSPAFTTVA